MCDVLPDEAVLVRSAYLRNDIRASALVDEARRRASELARQAQGEAERLYREAKAEGYAAGIVQAVEALTDYLADHCALAARLREQLQEQAATLLQRSVNHPDVVMAAFEECLREQDLTAMRLDLLLPASMRAGHGSLMARLRQVGVQVNIEYRQDTRFLLRMGDHVVEFAPDDFVTLAGARAMAGLPSIDAESADIAARCRARLAALFGTPPGRSDSSTAQERT